VLSLRDRDEVPVHCVPSSHAIDIARDLAIPKGFVHAINRDADVATTLRWCNTHAMTSGVADEVSSPPDPTAFVLRGIVNSDNDFSAKLLASRKTITCTAATEDRAQRFACENAIRRLPAITV